MVCAFCMVAIRFDFIFFFFFFNDTATTEIYTLSLHDALPISRSLPIGAGSTPGPPAGRSPARPPSRSEEHTSELQSQSNLVCRLLLEKKKKKQINLHHKKKKQKKRIKNEKENKI